MERDQPQTDESNEDAAIQVAIRRGQEAIAKGDVLTHEEVKRHLSSRYGNIVNPDERK
jgi:predicted transcriptional regulator